VFAGSLVDAGVVYVAQAGPANGPSLLHALRASVGTALWTWPQGASVSAALFETMPRSSGVALGVMAVATGVVYVEAGTALVALSSAGKQQWRAPDLVVSGTKFALG
jgi:outer membrane protein assembly factor BamB